MNDLISFTHNTIKYLLYKPKLTAKVIGVSEKNETVSIPTSVVYSNKNYLITEIGSNSFSKNKKIQTILFPKDSSICSIGSNAFESSTITTITIPDSVKIIENCCFKDCSLLRTVNISDNSELSIISNEAFANSNITSFFIPPKLTKIGPQCFSYAFSLVNITISAKNTNFTFYHNRDFLLGKSGKSDTYDIIYFVRRGIEKVTIPSEITQINTFAFRDCNFSDFSIQFEPNSKLENIQPCSFYNCNFEKFTIPSNVIYVGSFAFEKCYNLVSVYFENTNSCILHLTLLLYRQSST